MRMNEEIRVPEVRLIGEEGEQLGIVPVAEAIRKAKEIELDLVEISPTAEPPVCRIMDFGKFKYQQQKKDHEQKKRHHGAEIKQLRIKTFRIDRHDIEIKLKQARNFIEDGNRLLITLLFKAREHSHAEMGEQLLKDEFAKKLEDVAKMDAPPAKDGRRMTMMLSPLPNVQKLVSQKERERLARERKAKSSASTSARMHASAAAVTADAEPETEADDEEE